MRMWKILWLLQRLVIQKVKQNKFKIKIIIIQITMLFIYLRFNKILRLLMLIKNNKIYNFKIKEENI